METGTLVKLSETAKIQAGIDSDGSEVYALIVNNIDMGKLMGLPESNPGFEVFIPGRGIEVFYNVDVEEVKMENKKIIAVSGGFDPIHIGHVRMIREASLHGDVVVIANSDEWLRRKKSYIFMPFSYQHFCTIFCQAVWICP